MTALPQEDVEGIVRLLGNVAGSTLPLEDRRRIILTGLGSLIDADIWVWLISRRTAADPYPTALKVIDGGWRDDAERAGFLRTLHMPEMNRHPNAITDSAQHATQLRQEFMPENGPETGPLLAQWSKLSGMRECVLSIYKLDESTLSGFGYHRRVGRPPFTERERCIVHVVTSQIDWLHRAEIDMPGNTDRLLDLTPRQREILLYLLGGDSRKQIAYRLKLSEFTIADHAKEIYKHLNVSSRPELLALFMSGGTRAGE